MNSAPTLLRVVITHPANQDLAEGNGFLGTVTPSSWVIVSIT